MKQTWKIAKWEIMRNLRNKQFIIGLLITPLIFALFGGVPHLLERWNEPAVATYYVLDELNILSNLEGLDTGNVELIPFTGEQSNIAEAVSKQEFTGYFLLDPTFLETGQLELYYDKRDNQAVSVLQGLLTSVLQHLRMQDAQIAPEQLAYLTANAQVLPVAIEEASVSGGSEVMVSFAFVGILFFLIFSSGTMLMQSALQERRDRMAEVILSSISPAHLMQGKILGHFFLGIFQLAFWLILGLPLVTLFLDFPIWEAIRSTNIPLVLFFSVFGYLLFSSLYVSLGATMEDLQSAGNSQGLVIMLPMLSFLFLGPVVQNPEGIIAQFASLFPLTSPAIMIVRSSISSVPWWQVVSSGMLLIVTTMIIIRIAAKIFRVGMLMYGKTASISEIVKWLQYRDV